MAYPDVLDTIIGARPAAADPKAARKHYDAGLELEAAGDRAGAIDEYRRAVQLGGDPDHAFRLAFALDLAGEEDEALAVYEELGRRHEPHVNALINLAILYEDRGELNRAERCLKQVLDTNSNHPRARLYLADVTASRDMYYDAHEDREQLKYNALMDTPVTDFELSVRARNCLKKMQIRTLGDLLRVTETELMSYKNFGESSLDEIRDMLEIKGLRMGQAADGSMSRARRQIYDELRGKATDAVLNKSINVLDLTVRARKALQMLNIQTLGDLASRTEAELMGVKNFGSTSLDEVREKLAHFGLSLRTLE